MSRRSLPEIKARLSTQEQRAADILIENEFLPNKEQRSLAEIADELGVEVRTLFNWRQKPAFIQYVSMTSDRRLASARAKADSQLMKLVNGVSMNGLPSVKGLEMYYKLIGRMQDKTDITIHQGEHTARRTVEEVGKGIDELHDMLNED